MRKVIIWALIIVIAAFCTGCFPGLSGGGDAGVNEGDGAETDAKGGNGEDTSNSVKYWEYFGKIELGDSLAKVTEVMGLEGVITLDEDLSVVYFWDTGDKNGYEVNFWKEDDRAIRVEMKFDRKDLANDAVIIQDLTELKAKVQQGITYDEMKEYLGGVDGVWVTKTSTTNKYCWAHTSGAYVEASFSASDNQCSFFFGREV